MSPGTYAVSLTAFGYGDIPSSQTMTKMIKVLPTPHAGFDVHPNFMWVGQALNTVNYTSHRTSNGEEYPIWYRWDWGDGSPVDTIAVPKHMYTKAGDYTISLTVGTYTHPTCSTTVSKTDIVRLESAGDIILPNVFRPITTGEPSDEIPDRGYKNYLFFPPVISEIEDGQYSFMIYSRWGQLIYKTNDPNRGWNGYFRGRLCDEGVYMYRIEGRYKTGQTFTKIGDLLLMR